VVSEPKVQADAGSILVLAAVATLGFRLPRLVREFRAWREIVLAFGVVIFFVLQPRGKRQP
jgi:hypothetical protein